MEGLVNGNNVGSGITVFFQYGLDPNLTSPTNTPPLYGPSSYAQDFGNPISGLSPSTAYYYRIVGSNDVGLAYGAITNFTTVWPPVPPALISPGTVTADGAPTLTNLTPTFNWSAASQASSSDLIITKYPYGSGNIVATFGVGTTSSYQLPEGILQPGTAYGWYMLSFNSLGNESSASSSLYFWTP